MWIFKSKTETPKEPNPETKSRACRQFKECQELGIVTLDPEFELKVNDKVIKYYSFTKGYDDMPTLRYLQIQSTIESFGKFGMSYELATDYIDDAIEQLVDMDITEPDAQEKLSALLISLKVFKSHQKELDKTGLLLELASLVYITEEEDPYKVDFDLNSKKIEIWANGIAAGGEQSSLLPFFSKKLNLESAGLTKLFSQFNMLSIPNPTESQAREMTLMRNSLILDMARLQEGLKGSTRLSPLKRAVRAYRITLDAANLKLKNLEYSTT